MCTLHLCRKYVLIQEQNLCLFVCEARREKNSAMFYRELWEYPIQLNVGISYTKYLAACASNNLLVYCTVLLQIKWCAWCAVYCALIGFANSKTSDDAKQVFSSFMYVQHIGIKNHVLLLLLHYLILLYVFYGYKILTQFCYCDYRVFCGVSNTWCVFGLLFQVINIFCGHVLYAKSDTSNASLAIEEHRQG